MDFFKDYLLNFIKDNILILLVIIINIFGFTYLIVKNNKVEPVINDNAIALEPVEEDSFNEEEDITKILVDVKGAVKKPGVYELDNTSIVNDAIVSAGGVTNKGTTALLNLSKKISDGMVIYVATTTEINKLKSTNVLSTGQDIVSDTIVVSNDAKVTKEESIGYIDSNETKENIEQTIDTPKENSVTEISSNVETKDSKISINTATIEELTSISGIGESKAKSIISYREENGSFKTIEDILNVQGIGQSLYEKIKDYIKI